MNQNKVKNKIIYSVLVLILVLFYGITNVQYAYAKSNDYTLDGAKRISIPETYKLKKIINNLGDSKSSNNLFKSPEDIFINEQGYIFIADTGNNRIVKMSHEGKLLGIFTGGKNKPLNSPRGIYVDKEGNMYIADTGNKRIVHLSSDGEYVEEFVKPDSSLLGSYFTFEPSKVSVSTTGYIYVVKGQNVLIIDSYNRFRGFLGQTNIGFNFVDVLLRKLASQEQQKYIKDRTAAAYTNISLDEKGMIYATTLDNKEGEIKKINSVGENIYKKYGSISDSSKGISLSFLTKLSVADKTFTYGERVDGDNKPIMPNFIDLAVDKEGNVTAIEQKTGKIYQYNQDGDLLTVFGGKGDQKGLFNIPSSIAQDSDGNIYVLDMSLNNIQVFEPTRFINLVHQATKLYLDGNYEDSYKVWKEVLQIDENYQTATTSIAKVLYKQKLYKESMTEYTMSDDRDGYSAAFEKYRHEIFRNRFGIVILCIILMVVFTIFIMKLLKKVSNNSIYKSRTKDTNRLKTSKVLKLSLATIFHPTEVFEQIKNDRDKLNYIPSIIILVLVVAVRIAYIFIVHYPLSDIDPRNANFLLEVVKLLLPIITWVIASYGITSIVGGESKLGEIFVITTFCMIPYILLNIPIPLISNFLGRSEKGLYALLINVTTIWTLILIFMSVQKMNDYSIGKTIVVILISIVSMLLIWAIVLLSFVLVGELYIFITGIISEFRNLIL